MGLQKQLSRHWPTVEFWLFVILIVAGIVVRIYRFGDIPPGLNQDEASTGYDAFALRYFGTDRNGVPFPIVPVGWGTGMDILYILFYWPILSLFGLSEISLRSVSLLFSLLSLGGFYLLLREIDKRLALLGTALLAISPWHIMIARWALESNLFPLIFLFGMYFLVHSIKRKTLPLMAPICFSLCFYTYGTSFLFIPVFLGIALPFLYFSGKLRGKNLAVFLIIFCLLSLPIALFIAINQWKFSSIVTPFFSIPRLPLTPRYQISSLFGSHGLSEILSNLRTLWYLLLTQDDGTLYNVLPTYGYAFPPAILLIVLGLGHALTIIRQSKGYHPLILMLVWLLASICLAALLAVNVNRINIIFPVLILFAAFGLFSLQSFRLLYALTISIIVIFFLSFSRTYFSSWPEQIGPGFFESFGEALQASQSTPGTICVTDRINQPYIYVLFYNRLDPHLFYSTAHNPASVAAFDRYIFGLRRCSEKTLAGYVLENAEIDQLNRLGRPVSVLHRFKNYSFAVPLPASSALQ